MRVRQFNNKLLGLIFFGIVLMYFCCAGTVSAAGSSTIYVNTHGNDSWNGLSSTYNNTSHSGPKATLKNATDSVANNGIIEVSSGRYTENGININKIITIHGQANTIVDGSNTNRIFTVYEGGSLTLMNMILINGKNVNGGAIYNNGTLNVINCSINNCKAVNGDGGAIYNLGFLNVTMSKLNSNNAANGGAIYCYFGDKAYVNFNQIVNNNPNSGEIYCPFGIVDANFNWWGSNLDPSNYVNYGVNVTSWMVMSLQADHNTVPYDGSSKLMVNLLYDNFNNYHDPLYYHLPDGIPVLFNTTLGNVQSQASLKNGLCITTLKAGAISGTAIVSSVLDGQNLNLSIKMNSKPKVLSQTPANKSIVKGKINTIVIGLSEVIHEGIGFKEISIKGPSGYVPIKTCIFNNTLTITGSYNFTDGIYTLYLPFNSLNDVSNNYMNQSYYSKFTVDNRAPQIKVTPSSGIYNCTKNVYLKLDEAGTIYYTVDNTTPTKISKKYTGPIKISKTTTIRYLGVDVAGNTCMGKIIYTLDKNPPLIKTTNPEMMETKVATGTLVKIIFNEPLLNGTNFNHIKVTNIKTGKSLQTSKTVNDNILILHCTLKKHTWYQVSIPKGSVKDYAGNQFKSDYILRFKTL